MHWDLETLSNWICNKLKNTGSYISKFSSLLFPIYLAYIYAWIVLLDGISYYIWMWNALLHFVTVCIIQPLMPYYECIWTKLKIILSLMWKQNIVLILFRIQRKIAFVILFFKTARDIYIYIWYMKWKYIKDIFI